MRVVLLTLLLCCGTVAADDERARFNYMIHCQGCHLPEADGVADRVPPIKDFIGFFLNSQAGRDFIIQVPGVSSAQLPDDQIAELMNWLIDTFSPEQRPDEFVPYSATEVAELRQSPESNPVGTRKRILGDIAENLPALASQLGDEYN